MTREKAIKALGLMEHVESIVVTYVPGEQMEDTSVHEMKEACHMAVAALRAQPKKLDRSRWVGCKECVPSWCKTCIRYDVRNMDTICAFSCINHSKHKPNNFCQSCGRPLTEAAWAELERKIGGNDGTVD